MRNSLKKSFGVLMMCCVVLALAAPSFAQWRGSNRYNRTSIDRLIRQAENRSNQFAAVFDRALDDTRLNGSIREDRLNDKARELQSRLTIARQEFDRSNNHWAIRSQISGAIDAGQSINTVMRRRNLTPAAERQWSMLKSELNRLASAYGLRQLR
jgi:Tfp pilus assembly protein FimT